MSSRRDPEGRIRRKLREMLEALGFTNVVLYPALGSWRTDVRLDVYAFEGSASRMVGTPGRPMDVSLCSWETMTQIVRSRGVICEREMPWSFELHPSTDGTSRIEE